MRVVIAGRTYDLPEDCEVTLSLRFASGQGLSIHPAAAERTPTVAEIERDPTKARPIVPGSMGEPRKPGTGRKVCPRCHQMCGASLKACPSQFCTHVFVKGAA